MFWGLLLVGAIVVFALTSILVDSALSTQPTPPPPPEDEWIVESSDWTCEYARAARETFSTYYVYICSDGKIVCVFAQGLDAIDCTLYP